MQHNNYIGVWTVGMMDESSEVREKVEQAFNKVVKTGDDWFYSFDIDGKKYFVADNGERGYTAMLPEEY